MSDVHLRDAAGETQMTLTPRDQRALRDMIDCQIAIDEAKMFLATPRTPAMRDEAMHGPRLPIQDGEAVIYPIACSDAFRAQDRDEPLPACRWVADAAGGVSCTLCGKHEGPGMARERMLRSMVDGTYSPRDDARALRVVP